MASSIGCGQETVALIDNNLRAERGLSVFDMRYSLSMNSTYEFPLARARWVDLLLPPPNARGSTRSTTGQEVSSYAWLIAFADLGGLSTTFWEASSKNSTRPSR